MSNKICLEYIWIDGNDTMRSKNRIINTNSTNLLKNGVYSFSYSIFSQLS